MYRQYLGAADGLTHVIVRHLDRPTEVAQSQVTCPTTNTRAQARIFFDRSDEERNIEATRSLLGVNTSNVPHRGRGKYLDGGAR